MFTLAMPSVSASKAQTRHVAVWLAGLCIVALAGCEKKTEAPVAPKMVKVFVVGASIDTPEMPAAPTRYEKDPAQLSFDMAGRLMSVLVAEGDAIVPGQAVARLDPLDVALSESSSRVQFAAAQAELDTAEAEFKRFAELRNKGFISQTEFERREAQLKLSRAKFEATADALGYVTLRAIGAGRVASVLAAPGALMAPRQVLVLVRVSGDERTRVTRSRDRAEVDRGRSRLMIPISSVIDGVAVYRIQISQAQGASAGLGTLERVPIRIGATTENAVEVLSGLQRGDSIVAAGMHVLAEGETVRLMKP